jgi:exosortase
MNAKIFWLLCGVLPLPLLLTYFYSLWQIEQYGFFVVLLLSIGAMFYARWDRVLRLPSNKTSKSLLAIGIAIILAASFLWSPWLGYLGFLLSFSSFALTQHEKPEKEGHEPISAGTLFYLSIAPWLCLRPPLSLDQKLTLYLQHLTARLSSYVLDLLAIPHHITGVVFDLTGGKLFVEEACSGVQSLFALLCIALLFLALNRRPILLAPFYVAAAIFSAGLLNLVRVTSIAVAQEWYSTDLTKGISHDALGYLCLVLAVLLLASFDRLFRVIFFPLSDDTNPLGMQRLPNPFKMLWNFLLSPVQIKSKSNAINNIPSKLISSLLFSITTIGLGTQLVFGSQDWLRDRNPSARVFAVNSPQVWIPPTDLFVTSGSLVLEGHEQSRDGSDISDGEYVDVWKFYDSQSRLRHRVAISQPYAGFHDLSNCYNGNGWFLKDKQLVSELSGQPFTEEWPFLLSTFVNEAGEYGYLSYSAFDSVGDLIPPPPDNLADILKGRLFFALGGKLNVNQHTMFQIWTVADRELTPKETEDLKALQIQLRGKVITALRNHIGR